MECLDDLDASLPYLLREHPILYVGLASSPLSCSPALLLSTSPLSVRVPSVLYEFFQVFNIVPGMFRSVLEDFEIPGYDFEPIKKGTNVYISTTTINDAHDIDNLDKPVAWKIHNMFDPDSTFKRMQEGGKSDKRKLTFGAGKRRCLGEPLSRAEQKVFLCELFRNYEYSIRRPPGEPKVPEFGTFPINGPKKPVTVLLKEKH